MVKLSVEHAILKAKSHEKKGEVQEAIKLYRMILQSFPNNKKVQKFLTNLTKRSHINASNIPSADIINQLAIKYKKGQLEYVAEQAKILVKQYPNAHVIWNMLGAALIGLGTNSEAEAAFEIVTKLDPKGAQGFSNLGAALQAQGKMSAALEAYNKALALKPDYADAHHNLGFILNEIGKPTEAINAYKKALTIKADYAEAYNNMGTALKGLGEQGEAIAAYNKALELKPNYSAAHNNLGIVLKDQGKLEKSVSAFDRAISLDPTNAIFYKNKGNALKDQGELESAIKTYKTALSIKADFAEVWINGAAVLETWNELDQLTVWLEKAFSVLKVAPADLLFFKAKLLWRNKAFLEAGELVDNIEVEAISKIRKPDFLSLTAKRLEKLNKFDEAFLCFSEMNALTRNSSEFIKCDPENFFRTIKNVPDKIKSIPGRTKNHQIIKSSDFTPVFLVGFPRSGTTLLDTILRSHSKIAVVEEQPAINVTKKFLQSEGYKDILGQSLPDELLEEGRKIYKAEFYRHVEEPESTSVFIDKLPLNILETPLIHKLYPGAKFILALRHPLDSILSCWMQNFRLNAAMANMLDLCRIVEFYSISMEIFKICRHKYNLAVHEIRYEDLVESLQLQITSLLSFLGLHWETKMENYINTAKKRRKINTPSYSQVVQPIYTDAKYRWLNYEAYLNQYLDSVGPWLDEFGYSGRAGTTV